MMGTWWKRCDGRTDALNQSYSCLVAAKNKTAVRQSYLCNGKPCTSKTACLHWKNSLTHWGRVTHIICINKLTIIGSDNGLSPGRRQAIIWTNAGILLIWPLGTNFGEILIKIDIFSFMKMHLKLSSGIWQPFCLSLNVLISLPINSLQCILHLQPQTTIHSILYRSLTYLSTKYLLVIMMIN